MFDGNFNANKFFLPMDRHFAGFMEKFRGGKTPEVKLAAALLSRHQLKGHVCIDINRLAGGLLRDDDGEGAGIICPEKNEWIKALKACHAVGKPGEYKPLILDKKNRLYSYRYWKYQDKLAKAIMAKIKARPRKIDFFVFKKSLEKNFPPAKNNIDMQMVAAFVAVKTRFCVISGGPGTGKTTTVKKILSVMEEISGKRIRIGLCAPTGKAASKLNESIGDNIGKFNNLVIKKASTIHRLLGSIKGSPYFRHNEKNPLPLDFLIIDEASMVDLPLMSKAAQALLPGASLILLGDKDQLASVEAGAVLGDMCGEKNAEKFSENFRAGFAEITGMKIKSQKTEKKLPLIADHIVIIEKNYRFSPKSGISGITGLINSGKSESALNLIKTKKFPDIKWADFVCAGKKSSGATMLYNLMSQKIPEGFSSYISSLNSPYDAFNAFEKFRILCALRKGPFGAHAVNRMVEGILKKRKLINPESTWYHGRPILITKNDYNLELFNGDVGIIFHKNGKAAACFRGDGGKIRAISPVRLPSHETVWAMTVHKSQGSEFDKIMLILPDQDAPVLTRELIYTAITRAVNFVEISGYEDIFLKAVSRTTQRGSGLKDEFWA